MQSKDLWGCNPHNIGNQKDFQSSWGCDSPKFEDTIKCIITYTVLVIILNILKKSFSKEDWRLNYKEIIDQLRAEYFFEIMLDGSY